MVRFITLFATLLTWSVLAESPAGKLWTDLKSKRATLSSVHQEFEVSQTFKTAGKSQTSKKQIVIDISQRQWRESSVSGSGNHIRIFDGTDLLTMEEGGDEFVRAKRSPKEETPSPSPYASDRADWSKAKEIERRPCGIPQLDDLCVLLEVPLKAWVRVASDGPTRMREGSERLLVDLKNGLLLSLGLVEVVENPRGGFRSETAYAVVRFGYGAPTDPKLFNLPEGMQEVKELSRWNAARIRKLLTGRTAPDLAVTDLQGKQATLSSFKGKIVLLDFWTTWCPPCRADAPALDKLYRKYSDHDLMIFGISVSEDRAVVETFLKEHPHSFPIVLTTENEMPRPYQIGIFPTYIVIDRDGALASAVEGEKGFSELRTLLKKAGLEVN